MPLLTISFASFLSPTPSENTHKLREKIISKQQITEKLRDCHNNNNNNKMRPLINVHLKLEDLATHSTSAWPAFANHHHVPPQSPWHTPVPYLFGGLAVLLGLIAVALLILACSSSDEEHSRNGDEEKESRSGDKTSNGGAYAENVLVIMAGEDSPKFLAKPAMKKCICGGDEGKKVILEEESVAEVKVKVTGDPTTTTSH